MLIVPILFSEMSQDDLFIAHVMGGVMWALESNTTKAFNTSGLVGNVGNDTASTPGSSTASSGYGEFLLSVLSVQQH